jgi:peptidoglycan/xylan/chitin deacetylase (PgdA/CDA1 family)
MSSEVPQFIMLGFDDNPEVEPMEWIIGFLEDKRNPSGSGNAATFDGTPVRAAFYCNGMYFDTVPGLDAVFRKAFARGHEFANHTQNHKHGGNFTTGEWLEEITAGHKSLVGIGIPSEAIVGFRTPFLEQNGQTFEALAKLGYLYDTTLEEGAQPDMDGTDFPWPYTLDEGSPVVDATAPTDFDSSAYRQPGLWEMPMHVAMVPPDELCGEYGCAPGLRQRMHDNILSESGWEWDTEAGKITGLDYNMWTMAGVEPDEFLAIWKYTLDLRLKGNRAPLMVGAHTQMYPRPEQRRALEAFIDYALSKKEVRIVTPTKVIKWLRDPVGL